MGSCDPTNRYPQSSRMPALSMRSCTAAAQLCPVLQALADLALEAAIRRIVEGLTPHALRKVILPRKALRRIMVVLIAFPVTFRLHQRGRRIEDVFGRQQRT